MNFLCVCVSSDLSQYKLASVSERRGYGNAVPNFTNKPSP